MLASKYIVGTSGFSYDDWKGYFYPPSLKKGDYLRYYSEHFRTTEVNSTYYRIPPPKVVDGMLKKVPRDFIFSVKLNGAFTHSRDYTVFDLERMKRVLFSFGENLGPVLAQFPHSFHKNPENMGYVRRIKDEFPEFDLAFEFRSAEWFSEDVFSLLKDIKSGFVCVDEPKIRGLLPPVFVATSGFAYVRFHGRNAEKWYEHEKPEERYDYLYSENELRDWAEKIRSAGDSVEKVFIYFNNHPRAQAVTNAKMMEKLLSE